MSVYVVCESVSLKSTDSIFEGLLL